MLSLIFMSACHLMVAKTTVTPIDSKASSETPVAEAKVEAKEYGAPFTLTDKIAATNLLSNPSEYVGKTVLVEGKVTDICQKKGCWLVLSDSDKHMRVTTKDHSFFVDMDRVGTSCHIEGQVISREIDAARTAHFESEASKGAPIPEKAAKKFTYEIVASSIRFYPSK